MNRFIIMASLLFVALSCNKVSEEQLAEPNNDAEKVTLTASLTDAATRVLASTDSDSGWTFAWEDGDAISAWHDGDCTTPEEFGMSTFDDDDSAFSGVLGSGANHRFIYPYEENVAITNEGHYTIDVSDQKGDLAKTYLINDGQIATSDITEGTVSSLLMKHLGAFMVVDVYLENFVEDNTYRLEGVKYSGDDGVINASAEIDMTEEDLNEVHVSLSSGTITAEMDVEFENVGDGSQYRQAITRLNILPSTVGVGQSATIELTIGVYDSEADDATLVETLTSFVTVSNNSGGDLPFARATHNFTYLLVDGSYGVEITGATINDWGEVVDSGDITLAPVPDISYNTETSTYEIYTANGMRAFADLVNGSACSVSDLIVDDDSYFNFEGSNSAINGKLLSDVDLEYVGFTSMGSESLPYQGSFNGGGYHISGLYIPDYKSNNIGLFGYISGATIKNVSVDGEITGNNNVGGIVGSAVNSSIESCYNLATVGSCNIRGGGIAGYITSSSTVSNCYNKGPISGLYDIGGVVGNTTDSSVAYCYSVGTMKVMIYDYYDSGVIYSSSNSTVSYCYYDSDVVTSVTGAVNNSNDGTNYCGLTTDMMKGDATTEDTMLYYFTEGGSTSWAADTEGVNDGYPILIIND